MTKYNFDFIGKRKIFFGISLGIMALALICSLVFGVNLDIEFKGGSIISYSHATPPDLEAIADTASEVIGSDVSLREATDIATGSTNVTISVSGNSGMDSQLLGSLTDALQSKFPEADMALLDVDSVDPTIGGEFFAKSLVAVGFAMVLMILYVALRFKVISGWSAGVMAVVALVHDVLVVFAVFVIFGIPIDSNFMAVVLTILGYSLNDTIVIYDRIRENKRIHADKLSVAELVNTSLNQTISRTLATSFTTLAAILTVLVVALVFGVDSIVTFAFPMAVGVVSGAYSSVCIAGPLWTMWQQRRSGITNN